MQTIMNEYIFVSLQQQLTSLPSLCETFKTLQQPQTKTNKTQKKN